MSQLLGNISILVEAPVFNLALLIDGLLIGSVFALAAYGLALVWGVLNVKNLAQGDFVMIGGYIAWWMSQHGIHPLFGFPVAIVVLWGIGRVIYALVIRRVIEQDLFTSLLATFGVAIVIEQLLNLLFGSDTHGLPDEVLDGIAPEHRLRIPMCGGSRSMNLANAVAIVSYEAWRQLGFAGGH